MVARYALLAILISQRRSASPPLLLSVRRRVTQLPPFCISHVASAFSLFIDRTVKVIILEIGKKR